MAEDVKTEAVVDDSVTYELAEDIVSFGEKTRTLKMRRPTGADLIIVGNPVIFSPHVDPPVIQHDMKKMVAMIARLSGVPSSSIEKIGPEDLIGLCWTLSPFFIPAL